MDRYLPRMIGSLVNLISLFSSSLAANLAMTIFSFPKKGNIKNNESKFLRTAVQETIQFEHVSIMTYRWTGNKDRILLVHGWESNSFRWKGLIKRLQSQGHDIIALDAPAHGHSGGKLFTGILYSECIHVVAKRFEINTIVGHSMGGMSSVIALQNYKLPSVKKLVLLGSPSNFVGLFDRYTQMMGYNKKVINGMNDYCLKRYNRLPEYFSAVNFFKDIEVKGLIVHDKEDPVIPYTDALDIQIHYQNSQLITTTGFGHRLKSKKVYSHVTDFLNG